MSYSGSGGDQNRMKQYEDMSREELYLGSWDNDAVASGWRVRRIAEDEQYRAERVQQLEREYMDGVVYGPISQVQWGCLDEGTAVVVRWGGGNWSRGYVRITCWGDTVFASEPDGELVRFEYMNYIRTRPLDEVYLVGDGHERS